MERSCPLPFYPKVYLYKCKKKKEKKLMFLIWWLCFFYWSLPRKDIFVADTEILFFVLFSKVLY